MPGVAHACGHDVHTTVVLGAGLALTRLLGAEGAPAGSVRLLFEPAEESAPGGAVDVIDAGGLDGVDWLFGLHCDPKLDVGTGRRAGRRDHVGRRPRHDPAPRSGRAHRPSAAHRRPGRGGAAGSPAELPAALRERGSVAQPRCSARSHAGDAANVIPATAVLRGTLRTPDRAAWDAAPDAARGRARRARGADRRDVRARATTAASRRS